MLCPYHAAAHSQADYIVQEREPLHILRLLNEITAHSKQKTDADFSIFDTVPAYDLYDRLDYIALLTSLGCPYRCTYCASQVLCPHFIQRTPEAVFREICYFHKTQGIQNFAFYDDALLVNSSKHLEPLLEAVIAEGCSCYFHTPNGLHARYITPQVAKLMFRAGFKTLRLSLETVDKKRQRDTGGKVTSHEFRNAVETLKRVGFQGHQIGAYLFVGLPGQEIHEVQETIHYVHNLGVRATVCEYSPVPGTKIWKSLEKQGYVSAVDDPLLHNNSVFLFVKERHTFEQIQQIKDLARDLNTMVKA